MGDAQRLAGKPHTRTPCFPAHSSQAPPRAPPCIHAPTPNPCVQFSFELLGCVRIQLRESAEVERATGGGTPPSEGPLPPPPVELRGCVASPVLCFSARELGFKDEAHARALGLEPGSHVPLQLALFSQGVNEEQTMANLMLTHTAEQQRINQRALAVLARQQQVQSIPTLFLPDLPQPPTLPNPVFSPPPPLSAAL